MLRKRRNFKHAVGIVLLCGGVSPVWAAPVTPESIPGAVDAGRIKPEAVNPVMKERPPPVIGTQASPPSAAPAGAETTRLILKDVRIEGMTVYSPSQFRDLYESSVGQTVSLDIAWVIADAVTARYRKDGYFLAKAYVPDQRVTDGVIIVRVAEGYIGKVELDGAPARQGMIQSMIASLIAQKPLHADQAESFLLRLSDLAGYSFRAVLSSMPDNAEGAVLLTLLPQPKEGQGTISYDNYGSRFMGTDEFALSYTTSLLPLQQTSLLTSTSFPGRELKYAALTHVASIAPAWTLGINGSIVQAYPGFTLDSLELESRAHGFGLTLGWQAIRQRQKNLAFGLKLDVKDSATDILGVPFTRDRTRVLRATADGDLSDNWNGYNSFNLTISRGLHAFGASHPGELLLSRAEAKPDFTKAELMFTRVQGIAADWQIQATAQGQIASKPLYSSEEFGYGGASFGRAFDSSEITGDHGVLGALELSYRGWLDRPLLTGMPYAFCDMGVIWNRDAGQPRKQTAASAGIGLRAALGFGLSANAVAAFPIMKDIDTPAPGAGGKDPRFLLKIGQRF